MAAPTEVVKWQTSQDELDHLWKTTGPIQEPGRCEVLVEIHAVSLNYRDTEVAMGLYNHHKSVNSSSAIVPCSDMCGVIVSIGEGSKSWKVGDRVLSIFNQTHLDGQITAKDMVSGLGLPLDGVLQTYRVFPEMGLVKAPDYLTDEEACTLPIAAVTAWMSINGMRPMNFPGGEGEVVLLQGTGGVAISGLQIAVAAGAETIITSSSDAKLERAMELGATYTINYRTDTEWQDTVMKLTNDNGVNIILEAGGAKTLRKSFDCIAFGGLINCIGYLSGKEDDPGDRVNANVLALRRNVTLKGILNGPRDRFEEMLQFYEHHKIKPVVDRVFSFDEAEEAFQYLYSGGHFGKVVIRVKL
ncbi:alcohol dehydrogenase [Exophiala viscosa]|uniref:Alcohol dehydrogenase n=1 Tax=Exophiala viscosa TaxID=2486360 RepID=A0AAN6DV24_9EURO|nr:alcohol dehydrogenase [Exophiala viscosa]KAI1626209.1 alcohol dehydrogenase [Exophiala viscosa]